MALILDANVLFAALNRNERTHESCRTLLESTSETLTVPSPVLVEVDYWIRKWLGRSVEAAFLGDLESGAFEVVDLAAEDYRRVREICARYHDSDIGFVDAAVLGIVERLNEPKLATLDHRHFRMMRPRHVETLTLLPE